MTRNSLRRILKYALYALIIFVSFILQNTPGLFVFCGVRPALVVSACICIAIYEDVYSGALLGLFGGVLCDFCSNTVFGFNAILLLVLCAAASLLVTYLIRVTLANVLLLSLGALFIRALLDFFFSFVIWSYDGLGVLFYTYVAPAAVWSAAFTPIYYWAASRVSRAFSPDSGEV